LIRANFLRSQNLEEKETKDNNLAVAAAVTTAITATSAAVATASAATASATAPATVSAAIAAASPTTTAASAFSLRTSFIHHQRAAKKVFAVKGRNRLLCCAVVMNFGETETARLSCKTIAKQCERIWLYADFSKQRLHLLFCSLKRQVPNVQFLHGRSPSPRQHGTHPRN
jgi:hypothetical protein